VNTAIVALGFSGAKMIMSSGFTAAMSSARSFCRPCSARFTKPDFCTANRSPAMKCLPSASM
jgi:hypothetical protein